MTDVIKTWPYQCWIICGLPALMVLLCLTVFHLAFIGYFISRVLIIFYPLIVLVRGDYDLYLGIHWCILVIFVGLNTSILVLLFSHILPILEAINMIRPNDTINLTLKNNTTEQFRRKINVCYGVVQLSKYIQQVLIEKFGDDVALLIVEYAFAEWMVKK